MRILILSDLHANLQALNALQSVATQPDALFFLGDAVGYGPDPAACVAWLSHNATFVVQGDHDVAAVSGAACASPEEWLTIAQATCDLARAVLPRAALDYMTALPREQTVVIGGARFWLTHRAPEGLDALTAPETAVQALLEQHPADVLLFGHTHVPLIRRAGKTWIVNPGSLGQPRHGLPSATFALWEDGDLKIQHIDYDPRPTIQKLALMPLDPEHLFRLQQTLARGM